MREELKIFFDSLGIEAKPAFKTKKEYLAWVKDWQETMIKKQKEYRKNGYYNRKN
jgi:hypothetical protein